MRGGALLIVRRPGLPTYTNRGGLAALHLGPRPVDTQHGRRPAASRLSPSKQARAFPPLLGLGVLLGGTVYYLALPARKSTTLNSETFAPYTVTSREAISPRSVILTVSPDSFDPCPPYLQPGTSLWRHALWSVEFMQPEVQIARHYTPLPPLDADDAADGRLRFYIRTVDGGEMSNYLGGLGPGRHVWLRGPHAGFDLVRRLGSRTRLVFLAGGTGLVPGMQAAKAVLDASQAATVSLLWAVRKSEEVQRGPAEAACWWTRFWHDQRPVELRADLDDPSHIARQLAHMKAQYGDRLDIRVAVDEEGTLFREEDIRRALLAPAPVSHPNSAISGQGCRLHDQRLHEGASEFETPARACQCSPLDQAEPGKNLFIVSGPDGFVSRYAGPKVWLGGHLTQGPVGGLAARLQHCYPSLAHDWLVLKL